MKNKAHHPAKGDLLLSEPFLADTNFERSVVLICEHTDEGALGFVLNKPSLLTLADVVEEAAGFKQLLYTGGPCSKIPCTLCTALLRCARGQTTWEKRYTGGETLSYFLA